MTTKPRKLPPADMDAEECLLGALLIVGSYEGERGPAKNRTLLNEIRKIIQPLDFYRDRHGFIFQSMLSIADKGCGGDTNVRSVHQITVAHQLGLDGKLDACGGAAYLSLLIANCPTTVFAEDYARIVAKTAQLRGQIGRAQQLEEMAYMGKSDQTGKGPTLLELSK